MLNSIRTIACVIIVLFLASFAAASAFAQEIAVPANPPSPAPPPVPAPQPVQRALNCVGEALYIVEYNTSTTRTVCRENDGQVRQSVYIYDTPGVSQIFQDKDGLVSLYNNSGQIFQTWNGYVDPYIGTAPYVIRSTIFGGGVIVGTKGNVVNLNFPWQGKNREFFLYGNDEVFTRSVPLSHNFPAPCIAEFGIPRGDRFCLDAYRNQISWAKKPSPFQEPYYQNAGMLLQGEQIVAMGTSSTKREDKIFTLIASSYQCPEPGAPCVMTSTGRLVEVSFTTGTPVYRDLKSGLNVSYARGQQVLVVGDDGVYFPVQGQQGSSVMRYDFKTGNTSVFLSADDPGYSSPPFIGALAVRQ